MQRMHDNLMLALAIVVAAGCVSACFYMAYHSAMIGVSRWRDTPPDQRALWEPGQRPFRETVRMLPNAAKLHLRKALFGMLAFFGFFLLILLLNQFAP
jgi:hypothetical protein